MSAATENCAICLGRQGDPGLDRVHVWEDDLWRLSMSTSGPTTGFAYLEPKRHIPHITDLDGEEAATFGSARITSRDFPDLPATEIQTVIDATRAMLGDA